MKKNILLTLITCALAMAATSRAEEGGSGHYMPGATASFIDMLPGKQGFAYVNAYTYYDGSVSGSRQLPLGGLLAANLNATVNADTSILLYETPWKIFGGQYGAAVAIPYLWMDVTGDAQRTGPLGGIQTVRRQDKVNGVGDIELLPLMLGWTNGDLKLQGQLGIYMPTGDYVQGALANLGKNYWTFEPAIGVSYLSSKIGLELSAFAAVDISTKNDTTDYQSGDVFHLDATVAEHLPLLGGFIGIGANAFYYQQFTGDSGSGAKLGDFEGKTVGVGPVLSYVRKLGTVDMVAEVKWLPEMDVNNRLKGDIVWLKLAFLF